MIRQMSVTTYSEMISLREISGTVVVFAFVGVSWVLDQGNRSSTLNVTWSESGDYAALIETNSAALSRFVRLIAATGPGFAPTEM